MNADGFNTSSINIPADGTQHVLTIQDGMSNVCAASTFFTTRGCSDTCTIGNISYEFIKQQKTVQVRDFDFFPAEITVELGDTLFFDFIGEIPHTVTSDNQSGDNAFNSGLLQQGDHFILILDAEGTYPYISGLT